ncbi:phosphorylase [Alkalinema sp. FACHB-956]|uniref:ATP adenylyltransferase family protein n=1 Tax=Alkalinema sp. FACHB-956 TaxID=2692768 RepID=UPI00168400DB|nr:phosphorylase [Alkalinema sp. FACHB-956]MBD2326485.1 phosphorylase [Alkalinema sp. FACHB-956]
MNPSILVNPTYPVYEPGTLWQRIVDRSQSALASGALESIATTYEIVNQAGIPFLVRVLANLDRKTAAKKEQDRKTARSGVAFNPFLPYEPELYVADLSSTHVCLLNKFNVVDHHILLITREFEEQDAALTLPDFAAASQVLAELDGLIFYNGGALAGASQRHKHLQWVPSRMLENGPGLPIASAIEAAQAIDGMVTVSTLPFIHYIAKFDSFNSSEVMSQIYLEGYLRCLNAMGGSAREAASSHDGHHLLPRAYNLLLTRHWMMLIPRSQDSFEGIAVNSLGFAGALLVRNPEQLQHLKTVTPLTLLTAVGYAA